MGIAVSTVNIYVQLQKKNLWQVAMYHTQVYHFWQNNLHSQSKSHWSKHNISKHCFVHIISLFIPNNENRQQQEMARLSCGVKSSECSNPRLNLFNRTFPTWKRKTISTVTSQSILIPSTLPRKKGDPLPISLHRSTFHDMCTEGTVPPERDTLFVAISCNCYKHVALPGHKPL